MKIKQNILDHGWGGFDIKMRAKKRKKKVENTAIARRRKIDVEKQKKTIEKHSHRQHRLEVL